jgi:hypothetical protein
MSWLDGKHLTTPGDRAYWIISLAMTCGGMTSPCTWQADTADELGRMLAVLPNRPDLELLGVYRHELRVLQVAPSSVAQLTTMATTSGEQVVTKP